MKKNEYQNVKGTQDYLPDEQVTRRDIRRTLEEVFIQYGCKPLETPILNYTDLLASKYAGGAEILEEIYTLTDRGNRDLGLRYDLTIPFAKVISLNQSIRLPFKRYEIGKVFRDGPIKKGRLREFTQCDVDVVGVDSQMAEAELMIMALDVFDKLDLDVEIQYNNRKLLIGMLTFFGVESEKINKVVLILDKLDKVGLKAVISELNEQELSDSTIDLIERFLTENKNSKFDYFEQFAKENKEIKEGLEELKELKSYLEYLGVEDKCIFNPFLARGLEIYTGTIYEIFLSDKSIKSSIGSGGRYNNAIKGLMETDKEYPTVGISFGLDVIYTSIKMLKSKEEYNTDVDYYIIPLDTQKESLSLANDLRKNGYNVECDMSDKKIGKILKIVNKRNIQNVIIIGKDEVEKNQYKIKDMFSGEEKIESYKF